MSTATTRPDSATPHEDSGRRSLYVFVGGIIMTILLVGGGTGAALLARQQTHAAAARAEVRRLIDAGVLVVPRLAHALPAPDPFAPEWADAPVRTAPLLPQNLTMPAIHDVSVAQVDVQALHDGQKIAFRLVWTDGSPDQNVDTARFTDAVALQLPLERDASFMMGGPQAPVQVIHWKALWQQDVDDHFQDVQDVHPNYWADFYWFATPTGESELNGTPYRVPGSFADPASHAWFPAHQAQNPVARFDRREPVEELIAEGFGSLVTQQQSDSRGCGIWRDGRWHVVLERPLQTPDREDVQLHPGTRTQVGVAVWNGAAQNVGGRKQYSDWVPLEVLP